MSKFHCHCGETISGGTGQQERIAAHCAEHAKEEEVEEAIEEAVAECAAGPWIPVGERLPDEGVPVLIWTLDKGAYGQALFVGCVDDGPGNNSGWLRFSGDHDDNWRHTGHVTHWAEIRGPK